MDSVRCQSRGLFQLVAHDHSWRGRLGTTIPSRYHIVVETIDHFTVACLVAWPLNESEAEGDLSTYNLSRSCLIVDFSSLSMKYCFHGL